MEGGSLSHSSFASANLGVALDSSLPFLTCALDGSAFCHSSFCFVITAGVSFFFLLLCFFLFLAASIFFLALHSLLFFLVGWIHLFRMD